MKKQAPLIRITREAERVPATTPVLVRELRVEADRYGGRFYKPDRRGRWRKFAEIGNAGVAYEVVHVLRLLGHTVKVIDMDPGFWIVQ